jgi:ubiquinone/menaquinone biosynthesis C-methylase UbiE
MIAEVIDARDTDLHRFAGRLGWKDFLKRLDIYRYLEYSAVIGGMQVKPGNWLLDVGSASTALPLFLTAAGCRVQAIDIDERRVTFQHHRLWARSQQLPVRGLSFGVQDARRLPYAEATFDGVTAISVIEHIPGNGDTLAVAEMARVVKPGGRLGLSFPYGVAYQEGRRSYDTAVNHRIYDEKAVEQRILQASDVEELRRFYFSNRWFDFERVIWRRIPQIVHNLTGWTALGLVCSRIFFSTEAKPNHGSANGMGLILARKG